MKIEVVKCDVCGKDSALTCWFTTDRRMDLAGSMEDIQESIDLCEAHLFRALCWALRDLTYEQRSALMSKLRSVPKCSI